MAAGRQAIGNTGDEAQMRSELADAVAGVIAGMNTAPITVTDDETDMLLAAADLVTLARTGVEYDYRGDVIDAHAPEMPTRFAKQLTQIVRGAVAIGMDRADALRLAIRCARDSMPPLRLAIIDDLAAHPALDTDRGAQAARQAARHRRPPAPGAAHARRARPSMRRKRRQRHRKWHYSLADRHRPAVPLSSHQKCYQKSHHTPLAPKKRVKEARARTEREEGTSGVCTDFSGNGSTSTSPPPPRSTPPTDGHAAYRNGLCKTCHVVPYRPGGTQCEDCFQADRDALNLVIGHLGATPVDPQESAS